MPRRTVTLLSVSAVLAVTLTGAVIAAGPGDTGDAACIPVATSRGMKTAALVDPPPATYEDVDAQGCDIGMYFSLVHPAGTYKGSHVHGAREFGVFVDGPGLGPVNIERSSIYDIGDTPFTGAQHGIGALYVRGASGLIDRTQIYAYQKGGVVASGSGTQLDVVDSIIRGRGPLGVPEAAQNGIQFSNLASGSAVGNFILDHDYTPESFVATGLLIFGTPPANVKRHLNEYRDNEINVLLCPAQNPACAPA